jgi:hypothetical protein
VGRRLFTSNNDKEMQQSKATRKPSSSAASTPAANEQASPKNDMPKLSVDTSSAKPAHHLNLLKSPAANIILSKPASVAYFIELLSPTKSPQRASSPAMTNKVMGPFSPRNCDMDSPTKTSSTKNVLYTVASIYQPVSPTKQTHFFAPSKPHSSNIEGMPARSATSDKSLISTTASHRAPVIEKTSSKAARKPAFFPKIALHSLRPSTVEISLKSHKRLEKASRQRELLLEQRRTRLQQHFEQIKLRILIQKSRDRLQAMRQQAKMEYMLSSAALKRHMIIRKNQERYSATIERVQSVALMQKMKKFLELRRGIFY